jgi:hypothetical protein
MRKIRTSTIAPAMPTAPTVIPEDFRRHVAIYVKNEDGTILEIPDVVTPSVSKYTADELAMISTIDLELAKAKQEVMSNEEIEYYIEFQRDAYMPNSTKYRKHAGMTSTENLQKLAGIRDAVYSFSTN